MNQLNLKQRIHKGDTIVGMRVPISTEPDHVKGILDKQSYDFIHVDGQHSPFDEKELFTFCEALDELGIPILLRIEHTRNAFLAGNYLDLGPSGIEVPQVELESTVDEAIDGMYYSPIGNRSWGEPRKGSDVPTDRIEYAHWWSEYGMLILQLESVDAVTNASQLAKKGVDCLSFGPNDLDFSLEMHPHYPIKSVDECVRHVVDQLADCSVAVCCRTSPDTRQKYADLGVTIFIEEPSNS